MKRRRYPQRRYERTPAPRASRIIPPGRAGHARIPTQQAKFTCRGWLRGRNDAKSEASGTHESALCGETAVLSERIKRNAPGRAFSLLCVAEGGRKCKVLWVFINWHFDTSHLTFYGPVLKFQRDSVCARQPRAA